MRSNEGDDMVNEYGNLEGLTSGLFDEVKMRPSSSRFNASTSRH